MAYECMTFWRTAMPPVSEKESILEKLKGEREQIIKEGNLLLAYIYSSMGRLPKKTYTFSELLEYFRTLRFGEKDRDIYLRGMSGDERLYVVKTKRGNLKPYLQRLERLFALAKALEPPRD